MGLIDWMRGRSRAQARALAPSDESEKPRPGRAIVASGNRWQNLPTHPLVQASVDRLHSILVESESGRLWQYQDLLDDMAERDDRVKAVAQTRALALVGKRWQVSPPPGYEQDVDAKKIATATSAMLRGIRTPDRFASCAAAGWSSAVAYMASGINRGLAVLEMEWGKNSDGYLAPVALHWIHPRRFCWDDYGRLRVAENYSQWPGTPLESFGPDKFVVHVPTCGWPTQPQRGGAMRGMVFPSFTKRFGLRWWLVGAERFGNPAPYVNMATEGNEKNVDEAKRMLRNLTVDWQGVIDDQMGDIKTINGSGTYTGTVHEKLVNTSNTAISIVGLGQNLSTEVARGGSYAAARSQEYVRLDYLAADAIESEATVDAQVIEAFVRHNFPGGAIPEYRYRLVPIQELLAHHIQSGAFRKGDVRADRGYDPSADPEFDLELPANVGAAAPPESSTPPTGDGPSAPVNGASQIQA